MTALFAFLNDRSITIAGDINEARRRMSVFIKTYQKLTTRVTLRSDDDLSGLELAVDYPLARWRNDEAVEREERTYFKSIAHRSPPLADLPQHEEAWTKEALLDETPSRCCLSAYLTSGLVLSFDAEPPRWDKQSLAVEVYALDQELTLHPTPCELPHACTASHIDCWRSWIDLRLRRVDSPQELWAKQKSLYPNLLLFPRVEVDLCQLSTARFQQVRAKLDDLQREASRWTDSGFPHAHFPNSSPESKSTLDKYSAERTFVGPDGQSVVFTWHLRFTPGAGRLYYQPERPGQVWIGYIGTHLPTVSDPT